jgi:hypothetical protein
MVLKSLAELPGSRADGVILGASVTLWPAPRGRMPGFASLN